jgi:hypothetical protein
MSIKTRSGKANYKRMLPFLDACRAADGWAKLECDPYMPLSIEALGYTDGENCPVYTIMHTYTQNGDLMRDPEITFSVSETEKSITPLTYTLDAFGLYQEVFTPDYSQYRPTLLHDLDSLLADWLKNLEEQGFTAAAKAAAKRAES